MVFFTLYLSVVIILLVLYFIIELAEEDNRKMADNEHEESNKEPPIYMDMSVLKSKSQPNTPTKPTAYSINNRTFYDEERTSDEYIEFSLHAERLSNLANRELFSADMLDSDTDTQIMYCDSPDLVDNKPLFDEELPIVVQEISHGYVINSNVYLTYEQWNTLTPVDAVLVKCVACDMYTDKHSTGHHIKSEPHQNQLSMYKPLARFELSITRKIREIYHCAVCNEAFYLNENNDHHSSKSHEGNLLSAVNKVTDIEIDCGVNGENSDNDRNKNNDCYHFKHGNRINDSFNNGKSNYAAAMKIYRKNSNTSEEYEGDSEYDYSNDELDIFWDTPHEDAQTGNSYATALKKPKVYNMPTFLETKIGDKKVKVKFDSWHMLISPKVNRLYCMVCREYIHIRSKAEHCYDANHLIKLENCKVLTHFGDYLIREIDDKFYHCGHCNNLLLINDTKDHIEKRHSKFNKNAKNNNNDSQINDDADKLKNVPVANSVNENNSNGGTVNNINDNKPNGNGFNDKLNDAKAITFNDNKENNAPNRMQWNNPIFKDMLTQDIFLNMFGYKISIPLLSYHVICKRPQDFYCGLCNFICTADIVVQHIYSVSHIQQLTRTPFIVPFNYNLIRAIREALHCAICNLPVAAGYIYAHLNELQHIGLLQKALSPKLEQAAIAPIAGPAKEPQKHEPEQKITSDKEKEVKTEITKAKMETKQAKTEATKVKTEITKIETTESVKDELESLASDMTADVDLNESVDSVFDIEDYVYVKLGNKYFRISLLSYNSLVYTGCEDFYCFICSVNVSEDDLKTHVDSRSHMDSLKKCPFLVMEGGLLRQIFLKYHCGVCNVIITRDCLKIHMKWQPHVELVALQNKITKKMRRNDLNSGMRMYVGNTQKETIYLNEKEPKIKVLFKVKFEEETTIEKKMKIIIVNGDVLKLNFDNWNGVAAAQNGLKCQLCQMEFAEGDLANHVNSQVHKDFLSCKVFKREYLSDLLREIDDTTLHCVICNTDVANKKPVATQHIEGKKHKKNYDTIRAVSSTTNAYTDCDDDVLQL
ncbi:uncharacterized protein LOC135085376 isoform X1 [Ostrinia nubilalis]|uniref:uncharacterized protein LOC135085376 isoform X1 n=2 Tax=Ostrinia nubilalis TaxID=29057 RepID=UPI0030826264